MQYKCFFEISFDFTCSTSLQSGQIRNNYERGNYKDLHL